MSYTERTLYMDMWKCLRCGVIFSVERTQTASNCPCCERFFIKDMGHHYTVIVLTKDGSE
ncbi:hypothetical protein PMI08_03163 [Brevibacillus sp. CF112]|nr:hypothetical protein PMI08_03163 [Brevibacillus sp. CF112]